MKRLLAGAILAAVVSVLTPTPGHAIVGGWTAKAGESDFVVQVTGIGGTCTGSLLHPTWVLTAAHCTEGFSASAVQVRIGNQNSATGGEVRTVSEIRYPPSGTQRGYSDLALMRLYRPSYKKPVQLARPWEKHLWDGDWQSSADYGVATGWGCTASDCSTNPTQIQRVMLRVDADDPYDAYPDDRNIKIADTSGRSTCRGDSGGPLLFRGESDSIYRQAGVASTSNCMGSTRQTEVGAGPNRDWIRSQIYDIDVPRSAASYEPANTSIVFHKPGYAAFGTLNGNTYWQKQTVYMPTYTHAVASRDTAMFYNSNTGAAETGTLVDGIYTRRQTTALGAGWTHLVASCDSYLAYRTGTSWGQMGLLEGGLMQNPMNNGTFGNAWQNITASCDTAYFETVDASGNGAGAWGRLKGGTFAMTGSTAYSGRIRATAMTASRDSYLSYSRATTYGHWGHQVSGTFTQRTATYGFGDWDTLGANTSTIVFYNRSSGVAAYGPLSYGSYSYSGYFNIGSGWDVIAGAK